MTNAVLGVRSSVEPDTSPLYALIPSPTGVLLSGTAVVSLASVVSLQVVCEGKELFRDCGLFDDTFCLTSTQCRPDADKTS